MLVDRLDLTANGCDQREMKPRFDCAGQSPAPGGWILVSPKFFHYRRVRHAFRPGGRDEDSFKCQWHGAKGFAQTKGQRTPREYLLLGIPRSGGISGGKAQFLLVQRSLGVPKTRCPSLGDHLQAIMPGPFGKRAQRPEGFLV